MFRGSLGQTIIDDSFGYDGAGNLTTQFDALGLPGGSRWLGYDCRDRLTSAWITGYGSESFGPDAMDRLRSRSAWSGTETFVYDWRHLLERVEGPGGTRWYGHDERGNVISRPGFTHSFDALNRLTQTTIVSPAGIERYDYDPHGRRTATFRPNGTVTVDYYSRDGLVRGRADTARGGTTVYIHLGNTLVAEDARAWRRSFGIRYLHTDVIGTPIAKTDEAGSVIERDRRQSFGQPFAGSLQNGLGFTGHMEDPGTGLVYMQQRYYDPAIARFLSVDPVGPLADPSNHFGRYHYAYNNPNRYTDPDGRAPGSRIGCGGESKGPCDREGQSRAPADSRGGGSEADEIRATRAGIIRDGGAALAEAGKEAGKEGLLMASGGLLAGLSKAGRALPALRGQYVSAVEGLATRVPSMRQAGMSSEQIARALHAERNGLKIKYREFSPADAVRQFEARNIERYGNPLGPSINQLRAAGKSWDDIIESATRPGGSDLGF